MYSGYCNKLQPDCGTLKTRDDSGPEFFSISRALIIVGGSSDTRESGQMNPRD
jgi:hypothetical protein